MKIKAYVKAKYLNQDTLDGKEFEAATTESNVAVYSAIDQEVIVELDLREYNILSRRNDSYLIRSILTLKALKPQSIAAPTNTERRIEPDL